MPRLPATLKDGIYVGTSYAIGIVAQAKKFPALHVKLFNSSSMDEPPGVLMS